MTKEELLVITAFAYAFAKYDEKEAAEIGIAKWFIMHPVFCTGEMGFLHNAYHKARSYFRRVSDSKNSRKRHNRTWRSLRHKYKKQALGCGGGLDEAREHIHRLRQRTRGMSRPQARRFRQLVIAFQWLYDHACLATPAAERNGDDCYNCGRTVWSKCSVCKYYLPKDCLR